MCGIAGIARIGRPVPLPQVKAMADALRHRGPDDEGYLAVDAVSRTAAVLAGPDSTVPDQRLEDFRGTASLALGHRRLAIIDTTPAGHQPMADADGEAWIVLNGEIYNYLELRDELTALGHRFRTRTDTEVALAAYRQWGFQCLSRFNGMWSFAVYDRRANLLWGSRDRCGVKPFYFHRSDGLFAFASEIKALLTVPDVPRRANDAMVFDYLAFSGEEYRETFFSGIESLLPGHAFSLDLASGAFRDWEYVSLRANERWEPFDGAQAARHTAAVRDLVVRAVELRLRSDVPVGTCLSGGIDSSSIVCVISRLLQHHGIAAVGERQHVFTASYDDAAVDESRWAGQVAERTGARWSRTFPTGAELLQDLDDLVYCQDSPFGSTSIYAQYRVMRLAREHGITVLLDGQGGDELFTGYGLYYPVFFLEMAARFRIAPLLSEWAHLANAPVTPSFVLGSMLRRAGSRVLPSALRAAILRRTAPENRYIDPGFWHGHRHRLDAFQQLNVLSLNQLLLRMMTGGMLQRLLRYEDRNSMRFSVEARTPFADDAALIDLMSGVPSSYKIHDGWSKFLLRRSMAGIIPEAIAQRTDKQGFGTPEYQWLRDIGPGLRDRIGDDLSPYLRAGRLRDDWDRLLASQRPRGITDLWRFINLAVWKQRFGL